MITVGLAAIAVFGGVLYNNSRITDLRSAIDGRFGEIGKRFDDVNRHIDDKFKLLDQKLDHIIEMLANHHERISKLENRQ